MDDTTLTDYPALNAHIHTSPLRALTVKVGDEEVAHRRDADAIWFEVITRLDEPVSWSIVQRGAE
jgi:hypothetical protein